MIASFVVILPTPDDPEPEDPPENLQGRIQTIREVLHDKPHKIRRKVRALLEAHITRGTEE